MNRVGIVCTLAVMGSAGLGLAATIRPAGDPAKERVRWADPFDFYNNYAWTNSQTWCDIRGEAGSNPGPSGGLHNGPFPPGSPTGSYPTKVPASNYCSVAIQDFPAPHEMARAMWITTDRRKAWMGNPIPTPGGLNIDTGEIEATVDAGWCSQTGQIAPLGPQYATANYTWGTGGSYEAMTMFQHSFKDRLQAIDPTKNAIDGTDEHPLTLVFYFADAAGFISEKNNFYVELSMDGDHAPTDYVWRGDASKNYPDPDGCPTGPFPIICQQRREVNGSESEDGSDLTWLNSACGALIPPFDPATQTGRTWRSLAFGMLAIMDKDPCAIMEQGGSKHIPAVSHYAYFDGNAWRQMRSSRNDGLATVPPAWDTTMGLGGFDPNMAPGAPLTSGGFVYGEGMARVYIKIVTNYMMIYVHSESPTVADYGATIPRVYKSAPGAPAGFNTISIGVAPGCEKDATGECKAGSEKRPLTYSRSGDGYNRMVIDAMSLYDGELVFVDTVSGACCTQDGTCQMVSQATCQGLGGRFSGAGVSCQQAPSCCPILDGDSNNDGILDMNDFAQLQRCVSEGASTITPGCECLDFDKNGAVNENDIQHFALCSNGPDVPAGNPTISCVGEGW